MSDMCSDRPLAKSHWYLCVLAAVILFALLPGSPSLADNTQPAHVYFGDTHVHTAISADAGGAGTTLMPRDAYRFARGEKVTSNTGMPVQLQRPLDFYMITDHSDGMGVITDIIEGATNVMEDEQGRQFHEAFSKGGDVANQATVELVAKFSQGKLSPTLNYQPGNEAYGRVWNDIIAAAEQFNKPGEFTTFIAFEWTSLTQGNNLHRNVIFRDNADRASKVLAYTTTPPQGSPNPRDLWAWMEQYERDTGGDVIAIAHNGNLSNGWMFPLKDDFANGVPLDAAYAIERQKWERLYEWSQDKGDGEAHPLLSPEDEFADFESWDFGNLDASVRKTPDMLPGEYARSGLLRGLKLAETLGANPYKFGANAGTDNHIGLSTVVESEFFGKSANQEPNAKRANKVGLTFRDGEVAQYGWSYQAAGLMGVWANENTRSALFDAMERRETYATTGPRMRVRLFAGEFSADDLKHHDPAAVGYAQGVPMGSDLEPVKEGASPDFLVFAQRDPDGANLDRIQIIKGWIDSKTGETREKIYDVAWGGKREPDNNGKLPAVGSTVDLKRPTWTNTIGAPTLGAVWTDPDFDPRESAFYYVRVIEIPTPRWTAYDAVQFGLALSDEIPLILQERAYTSPIWYSPPPSQR